MQSSFMQRMSLPIESSFTWTTQSPTQSNAALISRVVTLVSTRELSFFVDDWIKIVVNTLPIHYLFPVHSPHTRAHPLFPPSHRPSSLKPSLPFYPPLSSLPILLYDIPPPGFIVHSSSPLTFVICSTHRPVKLPSHCHLRDFVLPQTRPAFCITSF